MARRGAAASWSPEAGSRRPGTSGQASERICGGAYRTAARRTCDARRTVRLEFAASVDYSGGGNTTPKEAVMAVSLHPMRFPGESEKYRAARDELLEAEIDLRRRTEEVAAQRRR